MKKFLESVFSILLFIGLGILVLGVSMSLSRVGIHTWFYMFFNDNPIGWAIMFGSIIIGAIGIAIIEKIEQKDRTTRSESCHEWVRYNNIDSNRDDVTIQSHITHSSYDYDSFSHTAYDNDFSTNGYDKWDNDESIGDRYDSDGKVVGCVTADGDYLSAEVDADGRVTYRDSDGNEVDRDGDRLYF